MIEFFACQGQSSKKRQQEVLVSLRSILVGGWMQSTKIRFFSISLANSECNGSGVIYFRDIKISLRKDRRWMKFCCGEETIFVCFMNSWSDWEFRCTNMRMELECCPSTRTNQVCNSMGNLWRKESTEWLNVESEALTPCRDAAFTVLARKFGSTIAIVGSTIGETGSSVSTRLVTAFEVC